MVIYKSCFKALDEFKEYLLLELQKNLEYARVSHLLLCLIARMLKELSKDLTATAWITWLCLSIGLAHRHLQLVGLNEPIVSAVRFSQICFLDRRYLV